ncbi:trichothecene efflux pump [Xylariales sp. PMI_506]|nr:trichothecene efflux pump [Xylariales sp. PMI_506]
MNAADNETKDAHQVEHIDTGVYRAEDSGAIRVTHTDGTVDYVDKTIVGGEFDSMPSGYFKSPQFILTVTAQCLATCVAYLGWVLPANTLSIINEDLSPSGNIGWTATTWTLGSSIGFLLVGRLSDIFGRRWMCIGTTVLGLLGCILAGCAQNVTQLIVANAFNGIAAAGQLSYAIVLGELVPNSLRGPISSLAYLGSLPFAVFGPIIARTLINTTASGWRWSYYLGIIISGITLILYYLFYHPPTYEQLHMNGKSRWQQVKELDYIGIFLFIAGCVLLLVGLSWGGTIYPWASAEVLCTLLIGFATLAGFVVYDSTAIGWQSSVVGGGILLGELFGGLGISYLPKVKWQAIVATSIAFAFMTSMSTLSPDRWAATIAIATIGLTAIGYLDNVAMPGITLVVEPQDIGLATGAMGSLRALGGAIAEALYASVLDNKLLVYLPEYVTPAALAAGLPSSSLTDLFAAISAGSYDDVPGINDTIIAAVKAAVKQAYVKSFATVFYVTIPFSVLYIAAAFFVPNMEGYLGSNVARKLQKHSPDQVANTSDERKLEEA